MRPARAADWPAIAALLDDNGLPEDGALDHLGDFLVATLQGPVVGCAGLEIAGAVALLRSVAVAPLLHRCGVGTRLVSEVLALARQRGVADIYLLTTSAADYFIRQGFCPVRREDAPLALATSSQFRGACPATADLLYCDLRTSSCLQST